MKMSKFEIHNIISKTRVNKSIEQSLIDII